MWESWGGASGPACTYKCGEEDLREHVACPSARDVNRVVRLAALESTSADHIAVRRARAKDSGGTCVWASVGMRTYGVRVNVVARANLTVLARWRWNVGEPPVVDTNDS